MISSPAKLAYLDSMKRRSERRLRYLPVRWFIDLGFWCRAAQTDLSALREILQAWNRFTERGDPPGITMLFSTGSLLVKVSSSSSRWFISP